MPNRMIPVIQQRLKGDAESICFKCFHRKVCRAIDNQPCIECNQFTDANGVTIATDNNVGHKWIPVTERLPEDLPENQGKKVINCIVAHKPYSNGKLVSQFRQRKLDNWDNKWYWSKIGGSTVTHWMPLPEAPKE